MIRWCMYCQKFLGEMAPYADASVSHGMCASCDARLERGEEVHAETESVRALLRRVVERAASGDDAACEQLFAEAQKTGLAIESFLVGMLQPALYQVGCAWQNGSLTVVDEHRFTLWCERAFAILPPRKRAADPLDLLIVQGVDNTHTLGPRFAARVLSERGFAVEAIVPTLPLDEIAAVVVARKPRFVGLSCAILDSLPPTLRLIEELDQRIAGKWQTRYVLSGFAVRSAENLANLPSLPIVQLTTDFEFLS
ncbi:MAG: B12-binding domain-containing protein [Sandaracinaceae bacterium]|nr:B12-binding domain-containing protein [Sandaracinaceae bacterium]